MNYFDQIFFQQYINEGDELFFVCHRHPLLIVDRIVVTLFLGLLLPSFFYYNDSFNLQTIVPFYAFEIYAILLYLYLIYKIFDWYNDVWLITNDGVVDIDWNIFTRQIITIDYHDIKGSEITNDSFWDSFFHKGDIVLYTHGEDGDFILEGAENPEDIAEHINEVVHEMAKRKKEKDKAPFDLLIHTLTEVVRGHLDGGGLENHESNDEEEQMKHKEISRLLRQKGTIDLRSDL